MSEPTLESVLEEMRAGFAAMAEQFELIHAKLDRIEAKIDWLIRYDLHGGSHVEKQSA